MSPEGLSILLWGVWVLSWGAAAFWSRRTTARASITDELAYRVPTIAGGVLLFFAVGRGREAAPDWFASLWGLPVWADWLCTGLVAAGFLFCWWARITLGDLWSSSVTQKESHEVIRRGPYALVRHPIYTGLSLSALAMAAQGGALLGLVGGGLMIFGFWLKARLEERLLVGALGPAYEEYRRTTPMLTPFWPTRR